MRYLFVLFLVVTGISFSVPAVLASDIKVTSDFRNFHVGDVFSVSVVIDTEGRQINAAEMSLTYPADFLEYQDYDDGTSVINLWVERPKLDAQNKIRLSGITPGGFTGDNEPLVTLSFKVTNVGQGNIEVGNASLLLHDGLGTADNVQIQNLHVNVSDGPSAINTAITDDEIPESFTPEIITDVDLFAGSPTLVFSTKDKGSGLDYFEIKEGWLGRYREAVSPYKIVHSALDKKIFVKAVDKNGNVRVEIIYPQNARPAAQQMLLILSILMLCVLTLLTLQKVRSRR